MANFEQRSEQLARTRRERDALVKTLESTSDPEERQHLEKRIVRLGEVENKLSGIVSSLERRKAETEQRRESIEELKEARREASVAGEGSEQEVSYLKARAEHGKAFDVEREYKPIRFKGQSQVPTVKFQKTVTYKQEFDRETYAEGTRDIFLQKQLRYKSEQEFQAAIAKGDIRKSRPGEIAAAPYKYVSTKPLPIDKYDELQMIKQPFSTKIKVEKQVQEEKTGLFAKYERMEEFVSTKVAQPTTRFIGKKTGLSIEKISTGYADFGFLWKDEQGKGGLFKQPERFRSFKKGTVSGMLEEYKYKPVKAAVWTGTFFIAPAVLSGVGKGAGWVARTTRLTTLGSKISTLPGASYVGRMAAGTIKYGVPLAYGSHVSYRVAKEPDALSRGKKFGSIVSSEFIPMATGGYAGAKVWPRVYGKIGTVGREEIAVEEIVSSDVLSGSQRFPTAPTKTHLGLFKKQEYALPGRVQKFTGSRYEAGVWENVNQARYPFRTLRPQAMGYHATGSYLEPTIGKGSSELEGLYVSHATSPHFLRLDSEMKYYGGSLFDSYGSPKVAAIVPQRFAYGKTISTGGGYKFAGSARTPGVAYVPGIKTEVEAVLLPGTQLAKTKGATKYFFRWNKVRVPIDQYEVAKGGEYLVSRAGAISRGSKTLYSYRLPSSYSLTTPSSYVGGLARSLRRPIKPSSYVGSSRVSSYVPFSYRLSSPSSYVTLSSSAYSSRSSMVSSYRPSSVSSSISSYRSYPSSSVAISSSGVSGGSSYIPSSGGSSGGASSSIIIPGGGSSVGKPPVGKALEFKEMKLFPAKGKKIDSIFAPKYFSDVTAASFNIKGAKPSKLQIAAGGARPILI